MKYFIKAIIAIMVIPAMLNAQGKEKPFLQEIEGTDVTFDMIYIPGGEYKMGAEEGAVFFEEDQSPVHTVKVDPFYMLKHEITWDQFEAYLNENKDLVSKGGDADAVAKPSPPYEDPSFGMGKYGYPAGSMTQYSALQFCKWLTTVTGRFYRLPTEAEWEYACRAGTETAYYFGDEVEDLDTHGWYYDNSQYQYHKVMQKDPNPWGLYDMHGNVAEWTLDQYFADYYQEFTDVPVASNPWAKPQDLHPRTVKGGSYEHDPNDCTCAARIESDPERWKRRDPQIPKSFWWNTDSPFVGLRVVSPVEQPTAEEIAKFWAVTLDE